MLYNPLVGGGVLEADQDELLVFSNTPISIWMIIPVLAPPMHGYSLEDVAIRL